MATLARTPNLYEFLLEAELAHYFNALKNDLKVNSVAQLKYVEEEDLSVLGMTKPEQRRLRKYFQKYFPQTYLRKIKNNFQIILSKNKDEPDRSSIYLVDSASDKASIKVPSKHIIPFENIVINKQLGVGEFGVVQQGVWTNEEGERIQVAIKCLSEERMQKNHMEFLKEAAIMHTIDHESIVRLYGVVLETNALMLVTELAPLRSLLECLKEPALRQSFPVISLCDFAVQICNGMQYLESKKLIHRDLACRNILVFAKNKVKISDFGLSRALGVGKDYYQTNFNVNLKLPIAWCAPECINYLRFTSASDVWAFSVTLWEMFSYGFQPWAALTGQQILEAIDEPNFQRLEQPECCPREYYLLMEKCWQHDANKRPKFSSIMQLLPEYKPQQVQAVRDSVEAPNNSKFKKDWLHYQAGEVITVLDKGPLQDSPELWKGVLITGKTGHFDPANTITYLGQNIPTLSSRPSFSRIDGKSSMYSSKRRLRTDMISRPQGDFKHTGHVGLDGAFFGDISFLGDKYPQLPKQIVTPYKPQDDKENVGSNLGTLSDSSDKTPLLNNSSTSANGKMGPAAESWCEVFTDKNGTNHTYGHSSDKRKTHPAADGCKSTLSPDHEYHEISDDELDDFGLIDGAKFEAFDLGPSLVDEVLMALGSSKADYSEPKSNDVLITKEEAKVSNAECSKKKHAMVKPISAADEQTLNSAIAMAKELASKSMLDLDCKSDGENFTESPKTPNSPLKKKFSFKFKTSPKLDRRNFSEETEAIPDIQDIITEEAKEAYNSLVDRGSVKSMASTFSSMALKPGNTAVAPPQSTLQQQPPQGSHALEPSDPEEEPEDTSPLRILRSGFPVKPKFRGNRHGIPGSGRASTPHTATVARIAANSGMGNSVTPTMNNSSSSINKFRSSASIVPASLKCTTFSTFGKTAPEPVKLDDAPDPKINHQRQSMVGVVDNSNTTVDGLLNPLPLPPRDRTKPFPLLKHHQRKHPLLLPGSCNAFDPSRNLTKQVSCPDVPSHTIVSAPAPVERRASEGGTTPTTHGPKSCQSESLSNALLCDSYVSAPANHPTPPPKPARTFNLDEISEAKVQVSLDSRSGEHDSESQAMYKGGDHVSCEDLLEFALDKPNVRRTQGRARGIDSDEVRIMSKVLVSEHLTPEECLVALNETDWDVHKAIKYIRLQCILKQHSIDIDNSKQTLINCNWDVRQASNYLLATHNVTEDTTEV